MNVPFPFFFGEYRLQQMDAMLLLNDNAWAANGLMVVVAQFAAIAAIVVSVAGN